MLLFIDSFTPQIFTERHSVQGPREGTEESKDPVPTPSSNTKEMAEGGRDS